MARKAKRPAAKKKGYQSGGSVLAPITPRDEGAFTDRDAPWSRRAAQVARDVTAMDRGIVGAGGQRVAPRYLIHDKYEEYSKGGKVRKVMRRGKKSYKKEKAR